MSPLLSADDINTVVQVVNFDSFFPVTNPGYSTWRNVITRVRFRCKIQYYYGEVKTQKVNVYLSTRDIVLLKPGVHIMCHVDTKQTYPNTLSDPPPAHTQHPRV